MSKEWIYRNGETPFSVTEIEQPAGYSQYVSVTDDNCMRMHRQTGEAFLGTCLYDLIPYEPYADFKIDDEVYSRDSVHDDWLRGHFAGLVNGKPTVFVFGKSLFTSMCINVTVNFCKKANKEDK
jgi:hypothetical protein